MTTKRQRTKLDSGWNRATEDIQNALASDVSAKFAWDDAAISEEQKSEAVETGDEGAEVDVANELKDVGTDMRTAPTSFPKRPRAHAVGYNPNTRTLYVVFRDNTWYEYRNVPVDMWLGLKGAESTGRYLKDSGLDNWEDKGIANPDSMSSAFSARLSSAAASAERIQKGNLLTNWTAKDYFNQ